MSHAGSTQVTAGGHVKKPVKGKHPAYSATRDNEPIEMTGTLCAPEGDKRTRMPIPRMGPRRRLTD
jgi:hypothetical protein